MGKCTGEWMGVETLHGWSSDTNNFVRAYLMMIQFKIIKHNKSMASGAFRLFWVIFMPPNSSCCKSASFSVTTRWLVWGVWEMINLLWGWPLGKLSPGWAVTTSKSTPWLWAGWMHTHLLVGVILRVCPIPPLSCFPECTLAHWRWCQQEHCGGVSIVYSLWQFNWVCLLGSQIWQCLLLALCSGITPSGAEGLSGGAKGQIRVSGM